ncbi:MAG: ATP-binding protein [Acidobacteriota bacterium]
MCHAPRTVRFVDLSIKYKLLLVILGSALPPLVITFGIVIILGLQQIERDLVEHAEALALSAGAYTALPLAFDMPDEALISIEAVVKLPSIQAVVVYTLEGDVFAEWQRAPQQPVRPDVVPRVEDATSEIRGGLVHTLAPVIFGIEDERYGTIYVCSSASVIAQRMSAYVQTMVVVAGLVALIALGFAYFAQGFISRPIQELADATAQVSRGGDMSPRVAVRGNDEIGALSRGFNAMLDELEARQRELERSNRDLDQFAYVASHDLKAPLRAIASLATWLEEDLGGKIDDDARNQLRLMRSRVERLDRMINGVLSYSRVAQPEQRDRVDVGGLAREIVEALDLPEGFKVVIDADLPAVRLRRARFEQVLSNLVTNAVRHHEGPPGRIEVRARRVTGSLEVEVEDDGPGIAPEHHARIFRMFQSLGRGDGESTGLGLALVRRIVDEEGGEIEVHSQVGEGACFRVVWPLESADLRPHPANSPRRGSTR